MSTEEDIGQLQRDVRYLMDRTAILDCIAAHARGCDRHDEELLTSTYHRDGIDEHGHAINPGPEYAAWANQTHAASSQGHLHNITTHSCEIDGDVAHCESYVMVALLGRDGRKRAADQRSLHRPARATRRDVENRGETVHGGAHGHRGCIRASVELLQAGGLLPRFPHDQRDLSYQRPLALESPAPEHW